MNIKDGKTSPFFPSQTSTCEVGEALKLGSYPIDWCFDYEHGRLVKSGAGCSDWVGGGSEPKVPQNVAQMAHSMNLETASGDEFWGN